MSEHRRIVADPDALRRLAEVLIRLEAKSDGWNQLYVDQATGDRWEERRLHSEAHGGGIAYLLRLPDPAPAELVALAVGSPHRDEAVVAASLLGEHPAHWRKQYLGIDLSIVRRYILSVRSGNPINRLVLKWFTPQSLTMFFMPCRIRLGGKSWSNCLSDQPPSASWQHRLT